MPGHALPTTLHVRQAKTQIRLRLLLSTLTRFWSSATHIDLFENWSDGANAQADKSSLGALAIL